MFLNSKIHTHTRILSLFRYYSKVFLKELLKNYPVVKIPSTRVCITTGRVFWHTRSGTVFQTLPAERRRHPEKCYAPWNMQQTQKVHIQPIKRFIKRDLNWKCFWQKEVRSVNSLSKEDYEINYDPAKPYDLSKLNWSALEIVQTTGTQNHSTQSVFQNTPVLILQSHLPKTKWRQKSHSREANGKL